jgi:hypothetical protein
MDRERKEQERKRQARQQQKDEEDEIRKAIELSKQTAALEEKRRIKEAQSMSKGNSASNSSGQPSRKQEAGFDFGAGKADKKLDEFDFGAFMSSNPSQPQPKGQAPKKEEAKKE